MKGFSFTEKRKKKKRKKKKLSVARPQALTNATRHNYSNENIQY